MKRIIAALLVALFVLVGGGLAVACSFGSDDGAGPAVLFPKPDGTTTTSTPEAPAQTAQPNG